MNRYKVQLMLDSYRTDRWVSLKATRVSEAWRVAAALYPNATIGEIKKVSRNG